MKFKQFINESLTNLGLSVKDFDRLNLLDQSWAGITTTDVTGSEQSPTMGYTGHGLHLPGYDMMIPFKQVSKIIKKIVYNRNPIIVVLSDGTKLFLTRDQYNLIKPEVGRLATVTFQANALSTNDSRNNYKIEKITIN